MNVQVIPETEAQLRLCRNDVLLCSLEYLMLLFYFLRHILTCICIGRADKERYGSFKLGFLVLCFCMQWILEMIDPYVIFKFIFPHWNLSADNISFTRLIVKYKNMVSIINLTYRWIWQNLKASVHWQMLNTEEGCLIYIFIY